MTAKQSPETQGLPGQSAEPKVTTLQFNQEQYKLLLSKIASLRFFEAKPILDILNAAVVKD